MIKYTFYKVRRMYKIDYNKTEIYYEIVRLKIKNLYINIVGDKVIVKMPKKLEEKYAHDFVKKKLNWIYNKIEENKKKLNNEKEINEQDIKRLECSITRYIEKYTKILGIGPNKVSIKKIKTAWGSCSSKKNITININLANKEEKIIEYVVLHEMCHLIHMNHSKQFWGLVEKNMPEYKKIRNILKQF